MFMVAFFSFDLDGGDWLMSDDGRSSGGWATESCRHGLSTRGPGRGVGLEKRMMTVAVEVRDWRRS